MLKKSRGREDNIETLPSFGLILTVEKEHVKTPGRDVCLQTETKESRTILYNVRYKNKEKTFFF